ncbi:unnamed protein product [Triticum turgidum subsp. durum]|uniref:Cyanate lyase C-terminal domain-containing protein n=1 Tax=Triticum turgidum subsp. durum TaxID=4567 RepID=A0A9R0S2U2_TRITD|nr:unnamed protein product [Triticum turgidum subsp. durum]
MVYPARPYKPAQPGPVHSHRLSLPSPTALPLLRFPASIAIPSSTSRATQAAMEDGGARAAAVQKLMAAKAKSGKSFSDIGAETGLTNVYVAQLLRRQAQLKPDTAAALRAAIPALTEDLVELMMQPPFRSYNPKMVHEPAIYRLNEAIMHFGESIKAIINEDFGDGIMSAIDFYCTVDKVKGADGKDRVVLTFDGKYLPHTEQVCNSFRCSHPILCS